MIKIFLYQLLILAGLGTATMYFLLNQEANELKRLETLAICMIAGGIGGVLYCLRGIYLNASVRKNWDEKWYPWYFIRPIVSMLSGGVSYVFLKAGLLILESHSKPNSSHLAYFALAFVAGLNVDKFIAKIEAIAKTSWGIDKSRAGEDSSK